MALSSHLVFSSSSFSSSPFYLSYGFTRQAAHTDFEAAARVVAYVTPFVNVNGSDGEEFVRDTGDFVSVRLTAAAAGRMLNTQVSET